MGETFEDFGKYPEALKKTVPTNSITRFKKRNFFLNNMSRVESGIETPVGLVDTTEHAYQLTKFTDPEAQAYVATAEDGLEAKRRAIELVERGIPIREDWEVIKVDVMLNYNRQKFTQNPDLARKLIDTGDKELVEGNKHGDTFWGVSPPQNGAGLNHLGKLLMVIRDDLLSGGS